MAIEGGTGNDLEKVAAAILQEVTEEGPGAVTPDQFLPITASASPRCAAVDGGSTVVLDVKTAGVYCVRTGYVIREPDDRMRDRVTSRSARTVTRRTVVQHWESLRQQYGWGLDVPLPRVDNDRIVPQLAEADRILCEYNATRRALHELGRGDLLLLDGSLEDEERYSLLRESIIGRCTDQGIHLAAVAKDTSLSLGGLLPFTVELEELTSKRGIPTPWWTDVTASLGRGEDAYRILAVRLDSRAPAFRVDVALGDPARIVSWLLAMCNDPAFPGYPYPLARVHQQVAYDPGEAIELRRDLEGIVARARGYRLSLRLFGRGRDVLSLAN